MTIPALSNAVSATMTSNALFEDLAPIVNDGDADTAAKWLWSNLSDSAGPIVAYDRYNFVVEALVRVWPVMRMAADMFDVPISSLARFVVERIPAAVAEEASLAWADPVTSALVLSDRSHDLAGLFSAGLKPSGSKDPYALRRSAKHFIIAAVMVHLASGARNND